ncbi:MAG TPA: transcriptional regulator [Paenibacillaceae bacterium]|nr:transcriptional regulator [Paenibacillaceae bacterium]
MEQKLQWMERLCKAIGHPVRLKILDHLSKQDGYYCGDLVGLVGLAQSTVSHHLKILKDAGLVITEEKGTFVCYRVNREQILKLSKLLQEL